MIDAKKWNRGKTGDEACVIAGESAERHGGFGELFEVEMKLPLSDYWVMKVDN